jgi:hypothetical protein
MGRGEEEWDMVEVRVVKEEGEGLKWKCGGTS